MQTLQQLNHTDFKTTDNVHSMGAKYGHAFKFCQLCCVRAYSFHMPRYFFDISCKFSTPLSSRYRAKWFMLQYTWIIMSSIHDIMNFACQYQTDSTAAYPITQETLSGGW